MKLTREQARSLSGGGSAFFKIEEGKTALVRFLYNTLDEMEPHACHSVTGPNGGYPQNILCARETMDSPLTDCKYCSGGQRIVARYLIPLYNVDSQEIQYWVRSGNFGEKLAVHTEDFAGQMPISGQVFKIVRTGTGTQTDYELIKQGNNDGKTKDQFGEIKTNDTLHMLKEPNYEFPVTNSFGNQGGFGNQNNFGNQGGFGNQNNFGGQNAFGGNQGGFGNANFTSTRRTTDMF